MRGTTGSRPSIASDTDGMTRASVLLVVPGRGWHLARFQTWSGRALLGRPHRSHLLTLTLNQPLASGLSRPPWGSAGPTEALHGGAHIHDLALIGVGADHTSPPACKCIRFAKMTLKSHSALALRT
jgi:hypothetical protein